MIVWHNTAVLTKNNLTARLSIKGNLLISEIFLHFYVLTRSLQTIVSGVLFVLSFSFGLQYIMKRGLG
jgi:hypothetical protein